MKNASIQTEIDAAYLYQKLADHEEDPLIAKVFHEMSLIERGHAEAFAAHAHIDFAQINKPSFRAKTLNAIGKVFGYGAFSDTTFEVLDGDDHGVFIGGLSY